MVSTHVSSRGIVWELGARDELKHTIFNVHEDYVIISMPPLIELQNQDEYTHIHSIRYHNGYHNKKSIIHSFINFVKFILYI